MTINSRQKGKRIEREAAKLFNKLLGGMWCRTQQHAGSPDAPDIKSVHYPRLIVEVKGVEKLNLRDAMDQAERYCNPEHIPIVLHKKNNKPWLVTIKGDDLTEFVRYIETVKDGMELDDYYANQEGVAVDNPVGDVVQRQEKYGNE